MCTKFSEVTLAVHFRETNENGELVGGPMYYIKNGLKKHWHWLAYLFSAFGVLTVFGTGNATQVNTITAAIDSALINYNLISSDSISTANLIMGIIIASLVALVLLGGIKRIGQVAEKLVPFMAVFYIILALGVVFLNFSRIPYVFSSIFKGAFTPASVTGGAVGSFFMSMKKGVSRGTEVSSLMKQVLVPVRSHMLAQIHVNLSNRDFLGSLKYLQTPSSSVLLPHS